MTEHTLPPPCPNCARTTAFKEMHRLANEEMFMCFFFCTPCALEYPRAVGAAQTHLAGWTTRTRKPAPRWPEKS